MADTKKKLENKARKIVKQEYVIWLTTVDSSNTPQPRPVWFIWDKDSFLIFSQPQAHKVTHIKKNSFVSLHFNTDETGDEDVVVYSGIASIDETVKPAHKVAAYFKKYKTGIKKIGMTPEQFSTDYSVAIRVNLRPCAGGDISMQEVIHIGDRVRVRLEAKVAKAEGWFEGTVVRIDPYSEHRSFYWVEFDADVRAILGLSQISVFNPRNITKT